MADLVTSRQFTDGERGITAAKLNDIVASSVIQPAFYTSRPVAPTADPADIALILKGGAYAQVPISALAGSATQAQIWDTRLRSFNAIGNPNFEVDQRNAFVGIGASIPGTIFIQDRWISDRNTGTFTGGWSPTTTAVSVPGTNFWITKTILRFQLTTAQASLAAGDTLGLTQSVEGIYNRELIGDVASLSLLVRSSVANLKFAAILRDGGSTKSLAKLCTLGAANTWTLFQLPNLPALASLFGYSSADFVY